jgi:hypothetical protein
MKMVNDEPRSDAAHGFIERMDDGAFKVPVVERQCISHRYA